MQKNYKYILMFTRRFLLLLACLFLFLLNSTASSKLYVPGDIVPEGYVKSKGVGSFFQSHNISDSVFKLMKGKSYKAGCPVSRSSLRYITCLHIDAKGHTKIGEMVVNKLIAEKVLVILRKLYDAHYPIEQMRLIDHYMADDETSMSHNNSSCFNYRPVAGSKKLSKHSFGLAVDINTLYNPCVRKIKNGTNIQPANGKKYINRNLKNPYMIHRGDLCWRLFTNAGFVWGGSWHTVKDYQHFEYRL